MLGTEVLDVARCADVRLTVTTHIKYYSISNTKPLTHTFAPHTEKHYHIWLYSMITEL